MGLAVEPCPPLPRPDMAGLAEILGQKGAGGAAILLDVHEGGGVSGRRLADADLHGGKDTRRRAEGKQPAERLLGRPTQIVAARYRYFGGSGTTDWILAPETHP